MNVKVDSDLCIGCGLCESSCPDVFEMKDNIAVVKIVSPADDQKKCVKDVAKDCPVEAIKLEE